MSILISTRWATIWFKSLSGVAEWDVWANWTSSLTRTRARLFYATLLKLWNLLVLRISFCHVMLLIRIAYVNFVKFIAIFLVLTWPTEYRYLLNGRQATLLFRFFGLNALVGTAKWTHSFKHLLRWGPSILATLVWSARRVKLETRWVNWK